MTSRRRRACSKGRGQGRVCPGCCDVHAHCRACSASQPRCAGTLQAAVVRRAQWSAAEWVAASIATVKASLERRVHACGRGHTCGLKRLRSSQSSALCTKPLPTKDTMKVPIVICRCGRREGGCPSVANHDALPTPAGLAVCRCWLSSTPSSASEAPQPVGICSSTHLQQNVRTITQHPLQQLLKVGQPSTLPSVQLTPKKSRSCEATTATTTHEAAFCQGKLIVQSITSESVRCPLGSPPLLLLPAPPASPPA